MTRPAPPVSPAGQLLYNELGPITAGDAALGWQLLILCNAVGRMLQPLDELVRDTPAGPGWSQIMDPTRAPVAGLPWLAQFVGSAVDTTQPEAVQRAQVVAEPGFARGTVDSITATARRFVTGNQGLRIVERANGDAYALNVIVFGSSVVGVSYGQLSSDSTISTYSALGGKFATYAAYTGGLDEMNLALQAVKPAGIKLTLSTATGQLYNDLTADPWGSSYDATGTHYGTYNAMTNAAVGA